MADSSDIQEIKARADIVSIVGRYVELKKAGRTFIGRCPFHQEKTPSFHVNPAMNMFKCFGCGEAGDIFSFIQKIEHIEFPQALEKLAAEVGIKLKKSNDPKLKQLSKFREINEIVAKFYSFILLSHPSGINALNYALKNRRFTQELIEKYRIGYAPRGRDILQKFLAKKGYSASDLRLAGFINERGNDKFSDRLMFPILDASGRVVGFSGRTINKDDIRPKYLNSAESDLYKKRFLLFGLSYAKDSLHKKDLAIMCEGQIDVIMSQSLGVEYIVAPLGTSLTDTQLSLLKRHTENIAFCFDNDDAGKKSLYRGAKLSLKVGMHPYIISLPSDVKDIDELIQKRPNDWKDRSQNPRDFFELKLIELKSVLKNDVVAFEKQLQILLDIVSAADSLKQGIIAKQIADVLGLSESAILSRLNKDSRTQQPSLIKEAKEIEKISNNVEYILAMITLFPLLTFFMGEPSKVRLYFPNSIHLDLYEKLFSFAKKSFNLIESVYSEEDQKMLTSWDQVYTRFNNEKSIAFSEFIAKISSESNDLSALLEKVMFSEYTSNINITNDIVEDFFKTWVRVRKQSVTIRLEKLRDKLSKAEVSSNEVEIKELELEVGDLLAELKNIKNNSFYGT